MDVFEAIETRRSIRKFRPRTILDKDWEKILDAARLAPSAGNRQPWRFVVVLDAKRKKALARAADGQMFLADASAIVAASGDPEVSKRWYDRDTMIALEHIVLTATALGYGTCWIGAFDEEKVKRILKIPKQLRVVALVPIGTPDEVPKPRTRKEIAEIFFEEEYAKPLSLG